MSAPSYGFLLPLIQALPTSLQPKAKALAVSLMSLVSAASIFVPFWAGAPTWVSGVLGVISLILTPIVSYSIPAPGYVGPPTKTE